MGKFSVSYEKAIENLLQQFAPKKQEPLPAIKTEKSGDNDDESKSKKGKKRKVDLFELSLNSTTSNAHASNDQSEDVEVKGEQNRSTEQSTSESKVKAPMCTGENCKKRSQLECSHK
jgi:outer membrane lipoprotein-sorting protein